MPRFLRLRVSVGNLKLLPALLPALLRSYPQFRSLPIDNKNPFRVLFYKGFCSQRWALFVLCLVPRGGLEPPRLAAPDFESGTSTNSITEAGVCSGKTALRTAKR